MKPILTIIAATLLAPLTALPASKHPNVLVSSTDQQLGMGALFRNAGYQTAYFGKVHLVGVGKLGFTELKESTSLTIL